MKPAVAVAFLSLIAVLGTASAGAKGKPIVVEEKLAVDDAKDTKLKNSPAKRHTVALRGVVYVIDLVSKDFDTFLRLEDAAGKQIAENDDVRGGTDSRLFFIPPVSADYTVVATCYQPKTGKYRLTVQEAALPVETLKLTKDGAAVTGTLALNGTPSPFAPHNSCKLYRADLKAGTTYQVDLESAKFDAYLTVSDASLVQLASDDDSGGKLNARIRFECKHDGAYYLVASGLGHPEGAFKLKIRPAK